MRARKEIEKDLETQLLETSDHIEIFQDEIIKDCLERTIEVLLDIRDLLIKMQSKKGG